MSSDEEISWRALVYGTPVASAEGDRVGTVHEVLGSDTEDVFHGLRVALDGADRDVMVVAEDVESIRRGAVDVSLTRLEIKGLPVYNEAATYHLASVGWLRKHLGWVRDTEADEEAGGRD